MLILLCMQIDVVWLFFEVSTCFYMCINHYSAGRKKVKKQLLSKSFFIQLLRHVLFDNDMQSLVFIFGDLFRMCPCIVLFLFSIYRLSIYDILCLCIFSIYITHFVLFLCYF